MKKWQGLKALVTKRGCFLCSLPKEVSEEVDEAMRTGSYSRNAIIQALHRGGYIEATRNNYDWHKYNCIWRAGLNGGSDQSGPLAQTSERPRKAPKKSPSARLS